jgi:hypothetical protein
VAGTPSASIPTIGSHPCGPEQLDCIAVGVSGTERFHPQRAVPSRSIPRQGYDGHVTVHATIEGDRFVVTCSGWSAFLAFARTVQVSLSDVVAANVVPLAEARKSSGWRIAGSYVPRRIYAGWFTVGGKRGEREWLWSTFHDADVLVVETRLTKPRRIVLEMNDRVELAATINSLQGTAISR